ncbi:TRAP transporter large permease [Halofilum ochraceum]|uniref:TRAP transporter large permease n=1 Tax=Halofilum ochraceum TaxID=1611323 RepID=UPI0008371C4A|nr:TRAP transporter large permease subunit [Halofilum ochraceum]
MTTAIVTLILLFAALAGAPLFAVIGASALIGFHLAGIDGQAVIIEIYRIADMPILVAIPLFTLAGYILGESDAPRRLVRLTDALLGGFGGGLAIVALIACALFTAFTGASGITIVALGALLYPALKTAGYGDRFSLGLVTSSGSLGILFAPSLPLILYGVVAQQLDLPISMSINDLFLAGLLPGVLMLVILSAYSVYHGRGLRSPDHPGFDRREAWAAIRDAGWELPLPLFVLGGIYGGLIAISEAAALAAVYALVVEVMIRGDIHWRRLPDVLVDAMKLVGAILLILGVSLASTNIMIDARVPTRLFEWIQSVVDNRWTFLILLNIFLLILGMMLDIFSALVIIVPILLPVALGYGIDPLHLGIIFLANMQIGYFTPPVGMNLFIASFRFGKPVMTLYRATLPFFFLLLAAVLIITYVPALSLWLPGR